MKKRGFGGKELVPVRAKHGLSEIRAPVSHLPSFNQVH